MSIGAMIERTPGICGGRARLAGTRVPVHRVAGYYRLGYSPEEMLTALNSLSLQQIYAALAHALANPDEMDAALREEEQATIQHSASNRAA
jgi:type III restriction enzyme